MFLRTNVTGKQRPGYRSTFLLPSVIEAAQLFIQKYTHTGDHLKLEVVPSSFLILSHATWRKAWRLEEWLRGEMVTRGLIVSSSLSWMWLEPTVIILPLIWNAGGFQWRQECLNNWRVRFYAYCRWCYHHPVQHTQHQSLPPFSQTHPVRDADELWVAAATEGYPRVSAYIQ